MRPRSRRLRIGLLVAVAVLLVLGGAVAFVVLRAPGNVSHPGVEFTVSSTTSTTTTTSPAKPVRRPPAFVWPFFGYNPPRTRNFSGPADLHPPFRTGWSYDDFGVLEFSPSQYGHELFFIDDGGYATAVNSLTGKRIWHRRVGTLAATTPAVSARHHLIFIPTLSEHGSHPGGGQLVALAMRTGRTVWTRPIPAGSESSPLVWHDRMFFGDQSGAVYSLDAGSGHLDWVFHAAGSVKGGPAYADGSIFFGDYAGRAYSVNALTGRLRWAVGTSGTHFGFGAGNFYSGPAVAFGRVYLGNTDGRVYSFAERTGELAWATTTGGYVYASPAVEDVPGYGPTVYAGSYDGNFYAFDARSGRVRWVHAAGGRISGSAIIVNNVVYFSDLGSKSNAGLDLRTGRQVFSYGDGSYNPLITDGTAIYLVGRTTIYQLLPGRAPRHRAHRARRHRAARHHPRTRRTTRRRTRPQRRTRR